MFKPSLDDFRATFRNHPPDFRDLMRFEPAIKGHIKIVQPDFTFVASFEYMNVHPLGQIVAVKTDSITILDEYRGHNESEIVASTRVNQTKTSTPTRLRASGRNLVMLGDAGNISRAFEW
jgi:hypothetical protein